MSNSYKIGLNANLWKFFVTNLINRRGFISLLSIYFLTLPNSTANQIGLYTGIGTFFSFLFEIPSGYFADVFGHKKTLVLASLFMLVSTVCFTFGGSFWWFMVGSIFLNLCFSFQSGTTDAFIYETLEGLKRKKDFTKVRARIGANVSLISSLMIMGLPFLTSNDILLPFKIYVGLDLIGLIVSFTYVQPRTKHKIMSAQPKSFLNVVREVSKTGFWAPAFFSSGVMATILAFDVYKEAYLNGLGYPIIYIGFVMGLSRFFWFLFGHLAHKLEQRYTLRQLFGFELWLFPLFFIVITYISNVYLSGLVISVVIGYFWGRGSMITSYFIKNHVPDKRYKASVLSIKGMLDKILETVVFFILGYLILTSYEFTFRVVGIVLFLYLVISYGYMRKK